MYILYQECNENQKTGFHQSPIALSEHHSNRKVCIVFTITRITHQLIISYKKLYKVVTTSTINRWCKVIPAKSGNDIEKYSSHSTSSACTSKAKIKGLSLSEIKKAAGWKETSNFRRFYYKPIFKTFGNLAIQ